jgi:hypothetical protein
MGRVRIVKGRGRLDSKYPTYLELIFPMGKANIKVLLSTYKAFHDC